MRKNNKKRLLLFLALVLFLGPTNLLANDDYIDNQKLEEIIVEEIEIDQEDGETIEDNDLLENTEEDILEVIDEDTKVVEEVEEESLIDDEIVISTQLLMEGEVEVSNWKQFKEAYNNQLITKITLKSDIVSEGSEVVLPRTAPLVINGFKSGGNYKLDIRNGTLNLGNPTNDFSTVRLENLIVAGYNGDAFVSSQTGIWNVEFSDIESVPSIMSQSNRGSMMRLGLAGASTFIFENNIDISTRAELAGVGNVIIKDNTIFKRSSRKIWRLITERSILLLGYTDTCGIKKIHCWG